MSWMRKRVNNVTMRIVRHAGDAAGELPLTKWLKKKKKGVNDLLRLKNAGLKSGTDDDPVVMNLLHNFLVDEKERT